MDGSRNWYLRRRYDYWPGLARLWAGSVWGAFWAVSFAAILNLSLLVSAIWPEMWPAQLAWVCGGLTVAAWVYGIYDGGRYRCRIGIRAQNDESRDGFLAARAYYLQGAWDTAESQLSQLLDDTPDDIEARLLLATLYRHRGRVESAKEQLRRLQRWRVASRWNLEIRREWERLAKLETRDLTAHAVSGDTHLPNDANFDDPTVNEAA